MKIIARSKKLKINSHYLRGKKKTTKKVEKISYTEEKKEKKVLIYLNFMQR